MTLDRTWVLDQLDSWLPEDVDWDICICGAPRFRHHTDHYLCGIPHQCTGFNPSNLTERMIRHGSQPRHTD